MAGATPLFVLLIAWFSGQSTTADCNFASYEDYDSEFRTKYTTDWLKMYPYGDDYCDRNATSTEKDLGFDPAIPFTIPFYGVVYKSVWISPAGHISLHETDAAPVTKYFFFTSWPNPDFPLSDKDPTFIAPFYSEADFRSEVTNEAGLSHLSYRILDSGVGDDVTLGMLEEISRDVRLAVVGSRDFQALYGLVVTWYRVTFESGRCSGGASDNCARNTFQMALVTDEVKTYVVFNYMDIQWAGGASPGRQDCDPDTGIRSPSHPDCYPGYAGFNAGQARGFTPLPHSGKDEIKDMDILGSTDVTGRYIYEVSGEKIVRGGCTNETDLSREEWPLTVYPDHGSMLGGQIVEMSGPCFYSRESSKCKIGGQEVDGRHEPLGVWHNQIIMQCVMPVLDVVGELEVAAQNSKGEYDHKEVYNVLLHGLQPAELTVHNYEEDWLNPDQLRLTWDPASITDTEGNMVAQVSIYVYGYREYGAYTSPSNEWKALHTIASDVGNTGSYTIIPSDQQCGGSDCANFLAGAIQVKASSALFSGRTVWSEIMPLGWHVKSEMSGKHGGDWPARECSSWYSWDASNDIDWQNELPECPCTLEQALADFGRFQPAVGCDMNHDSGNCPLHTGAKHCVVSTSTTSEVGAGSRCCYDNGGHLILAGDSPDGSTSDRSHAWGVFPYGNPREVPTLSHWVNDIIPYFVCCEWQGDQEDCYTRYLAARPTKDCKFYEPPGIAVAYGDPHFLTWDGTSYTFNGHGEFLLFGVSDFVLQIRMEQVPDDRYGEVMATMITAVALQQSSGQIATFEMNKHGHFSDLLVRVDDRILDFADPTNYRHEFEDFLIIRNDRSGSVPPGNFTIVFRMGVGVQVAYQSGMIELVTNIPPQFKGADTKGLMGLWKGDKNDDLVPSNESTPVDPNNKHNVHYLFGMSWMVVQSSSRFHPLYRSQFNYDYYKKSDFQASLDPVIPPGSGISESEVQAICGSNQPCTYDYKMLASQQAGIQALHMQAWYHDLKNMSAPVISCGWLNVPNAEKEATNGYYLNSVVTITGCLHDYDLNGPTTYTCEAVNENEARWSPDVTTTCDDNKASATLARTIGISVAAGIVGILLIVLIIFLICYYRKRSREKAEDKKHSGDKDTLDMAPVITPSTTTSTVKAPTPTPPSPSTAYTSPTYSPAHSGEPQVDVGPLTSQKPSKKAPRAPLKPKGMILGYSQDPRGVGHDASVSTDDMGAGRRQHTPDSLDRSRSSSSWDEREITPPGSAPHLMSHQGGAAMQPPGGYGGAQAQPLPPQSRSHEDLAGIQFNQNPGYSRTASSAENSPPMKRKPPYAYPNMSGGQTTPDSPRRGRANRAHEPRDMSHAGGGAGGNGGGQVSKYYQQKYGNRYKSYR